MTTKKMKKRVIALTLALMFLLSIQGCKMTDDIKAYVPDEWYKETLESYKNGFACGWKSNPDNINVSDEMLDEKNKFGYLLVDLNGDGYDELLIGLMDGAKETKFTDLWIWHVNFGATNSFHCGDGYYMYLDDNKVIKMESWYGSETKIEYMKYNKEDEAFTILEDGGKSENFTLTEF